MRSLALALLLAACGGDPSDPTSDPTKVITDGPQISCSSSADCTAASSQWTVGARAGGTLACVSGRCVVQCDRWGANCDGNAANGCEANLLGNANCGGCGIACATGTACNGPVGVCR